MKYETVEDRYTPGVWRVEAVNDDGEGECYVAIFTGPDAGKRAHEYAEWAERLPLRGRRG